MCSISIFDISFFFTFTLIAPPSCPQFFFPMSRKSARVNFLFLKWHGMTRALFLIKNVRVLPCFKKKIEMFILSRALFHWHGHFHKWLTRWREILCPFRHKILIHWVFFQLDYTGAETFSFAWNSWMNTNFN